MSSLCASSPPHRPMVTGTGSSTTLCARGPRRGLVGRPAGASRGCRWILQGSELEHGRAVPLFHHTVVPEEGEVVDRHAPVVADAELLGHWTASAGIAVEQAVQFADVETIGEPLCLVEVVAGNEGIVTCS